MHPWKPGSRTNEPARRPWLPPARPDFRSVRCRAPHRRPTLRGRSRRHANGLRASSRNQQLTKTNIRELRPVGRCLCRGQSAPVALANLLEAQPAFAELIGERQREGCRPRYPPHSPLRTAYAKYSHRAAPIQRSRLIPRPQLIAELAASDKSHLIPRRRGFTAIARFSRVSCVL
jgi:hypothetical protein